jgi:hypothetical protein
MHSDMIRSARAAFLDGQTGGGVSPDEIYRRFRNIRVYLREGRFTGGGDNNLVVLDYPSATPLNKDNFTGHFLYGLNSRHVRHVISGGRLVVEDGRVLTLDEQSILKEAREAAAGLWKRMKTI